MMNDSNDSNDSNASSELHPQVCHQREMIGCHQREPCPRQLQPFHFDLTVVVDVIKVEHGEDAGIRAASLQMAAQVDALQTLAEHRGGQSLHPFVEIAEHDLRNADTTVVQ